MDSIEAAIADIRAGKMVIVLDDEDRENEGDLVMAAADGHARGDQLHAQGGRRPDLRADDGRAARRAAHPADGAATTPRRYETAFTVSVEARGRDDDRHLGARPRRTRSYALLDPDATPADFLRPGHTFPLRARDGGVLVRAGQTEAVGRPRAPGRARIRPA